MPSDLGLIRPAQDRVAGKFSPIVAYDHLGLAAQRDQEIEFTRNPATGERGIGDRSQALPSAVIEDRQDTKASAAGQLIGDEIQ